jgi:hypothetical protein
MKKIISSLFLVVIVTSLIFGCTPQNPQPNPPANNAVAVSWQATINGVSYSYSDTYSHHTGAGENLQGNNEGKCDYAGGYLRLHKGGPYTAGDDFVMEFSHMQNEAFSVGTYNIVGGSSIGMNLFCFINNSNQGNSINPGSNITLNITEVPGAMGGLLKGNFNGVIGTSSGGVQTGTVPISGQFQAYRLY